MQSAFNVKLFIFSSFESVNTWTTPLEKLFAIIKTNLREYSNNTEHIDVIKIFTQWAKQERYPVLEVQQIPFLDEVKVYVVEGPENLLIPVTYITQRKPYIIHNAWLEKPNFLSVYVHSSDWIIINIHQTGEYKLINMLCFYIYDVNKILHTNCIFNNEICAYTGYYRVNYDYDIWQKLGNYLNSMEYYNIHVLNRAQIIDDAYYFLSTNKLDFNLFKTLTYYLSKETDYIAWYPMFKILEQISGFFPFPQSSEVKVNSNKNFINN